MKCDSFSAEAVEDLRCRWSLEVGTPFPRETGASSWVAPAVRADGTSAVLKIAMPHFEVRDEIEGLLFWNGDPTVRLLESDEAAGAMLLERCEPGASLRSLPEPEQDVALAALLRRLWREPPGTGRFRPLTELADHWRAEALSGPRASTDAGLLREGLSLFNSLALSGPALMLATDLHAGNVLRAVREPWLVIDPKPFTGDPAFDATQHLLNCHSRLQNDPLGTIRRFADLLGLDAERVRLWLFARIAAGPLDPAWDLDARVFAPDLRQA